MLRSWRIRIWAFLLVAALPSGCSLFGGEADPLELAKQNADQARALMKQEHFSQAADLLAKATRQDPSNGEYFMLHGVALAESGDKGQAIMSMSRAAELMPDALEPEVRLGGLFAKLGKTEPAIQHMLNALKKDQNNSEVLKQLTEMYLSSERLDDAELTLRKLNDLNPNDIDIITLQADVMLRKGNDDEAIKKLQEASALAPDNFKVNMTYGRHLMRMNKFDAAARQFEVALGINDKDVEAMIDLGRALLELNQADQAVARFQDALKRSPNDLKVQVGLGRSFLAQGLYDKANATIEGVITVQPSNLEAHMALGEVYLKQGNPDEAVKRFRRATEIDPSAIGPRMQLAQIFRKQKKFTDAISELEVLLMYQPKDSSVKRMLVTLYTEGNSDLKQALYHVNELLGSGGMDLELFKLKGKILLGLQDLEQAIAVVEEALVISPDDPDLVQLRAKIQDARKTVPGKKGGGKPRPSGITIIK